MLSNLTPYVIYALIALQILDIITTVIALRNPNAYESNWLIAPIMKTIGVLPTLLITKGAAIALLWYSQDANPILLAAVAVYYAYTVYRNYVIIKNPIQ